MTEPDGDALPVLPVLKPVTFRYRHSIWTLSGTPRRWSDAPAAGGPSGSDIRNHS